MKNYSFLVTLENKNFNNKTISSLTKVFKNKDYFTARLDAIKFCHKEYEKMYNSRRAKYKTLKGVRDNGNVLRDDYIDFSVRLIEKPGAEIYNSDPDKQIPGLEAEVEFLKRQNLLGDQNLKDAYLNETLEFFDPMVLFENGDYPDDYDDEYSGYIILDRDLELLFAIHRD
ncbi:MAG: hypothetical protein HYI21_00395 [Sediminibacterium sp. Gen4]|jgi:hypothetical protein|uniref:hypothetical protein n=1 Tax=unclassified Sediminibacterium TaxID=2635961 RepID=UPI0015BF0BDD|nr:MULTISPECIES: hypothetical protein [unclassified Sediminibacterium]MBW0161806.1 hypothetical protein [Sediminibacterium sp.]MBW0165011.1 hypothetical protein [Sediminibacterium sp.]NWK64466.1 hypothetical protein [Sediminibacterium sp. Gen4]